MSNVALHVAGFIFPVSITAVAYYKILKIVKKRDAEAALGIQRTEQKLLKEQRRRQMRQMLMCTVIWYTLLNLPIQCIGFSQRFITSIFPTECTSSTTNPWYILISYFLATFSMCINPFIYYYFNTKFKDEAANIWKAITSCGSSV